MDFEQNSTTVFRASNSHQISPGVFWFSVPSNDIFNTNHEIEASVIFTSWPKCRSYYLPSFRITFPFGGQNLYIDVKSTWFNTINALLSHINSYLWAHAYVGFPTCSFYYDYVSGGLVAKCVPATDITMTLPAHVNYLLGFNSNKLSFKSNQASVKATSMFNLKFFTPDVFVFADFAQSSYVSGNKYDCLVYAGNLDNSDNHATDNCNAPLFILKLGDLIL